jgi:O-acetylhomoserine/O-acetylserine sulfhydrylase-like pyridoxal-dependent enzyme
VESSDLNAWEVAVANGSKLLFVEAAGNPMDLPDIMPVSPRMQIRPDCGGDLGGF